MVLFMLLYYQIGFNWIRQSIANAFVLLAIVLAEEDKKKKAIVLCIFAVLFHSSAIIGLALFLFTYAFMHIKNKYARAFFGIGFIALFLLLLTNWDRLFALGINYGILPSTYAGYLRVFTGQTTVSRWFKVGTRTYVDYVWRVLIAILPWVLSFNETNEFKNKTKYFKMVAIIGLIIYSFVFFRMHSAYGNRVSYTIEYVQIFTLGMCYRKSNNGKLVVPVKNIVIIGLAIIYNIWLYYVLGWHDTVPFVFNL